MSKRDLHRERFIKLRPWLCHVSLAYDVSSIHKHGLLSTSSLLDLFEIPNEERRMSEWEPRKSSVPLHHPIHGEALLNDQSPLHAGGLERCLDGMTSMEWCQALNSRVYFRPVSTKADCGWKTKRSSNRSRIVLVANSRSFLDEYEDQLYATSFNPGYTMRDPARRDRHSFKPLMELFEQDRFSISDILELSVLHRIEKTDLFTDGGAEVIEV